MIFKSKHDIVLGVVILGATGYGAVATLLHRISFLSLLMTAIFIGAFWIWFGTMYIIKETELIIRCGPFKNKINLMNVTKVIPTKTWVSAPACSLDRIKLVGDTFSIIISPKEQKAFIDKIMAINSNISNDM